MLGLFLFELLVLLITFYFQVTDNFLFATEVVDIFTNRKDDLFDAHTHDLWLWSGNQFQLQNSFQVTPIKRTLGLVKASNLAA